MEPRAIPVDLNRWTLVPVDLWTLVFLDPWALGLAVETFQEA